LNKFFFLKEFNSCQSNNHRFYQLKQQEYREKNKVLKQMYILEDRVFKANLQQPGEKNYHTNENTESPLDIAKDRLLELEARIERRYLKHPFVPRKKLNNIKMNSNNQENEINEGENSPVDLNETKEEPQELPTLLSLSTESSHAKYKQNINFQQVVPSELERWRRLVKNCQTSSQLAILITELNKLIEWEKSIMKVICQICNCDDNEDKLLLCDNCDKGNHTYCFKPALDQIPEGDWYCFVCIGKLHSQDICCVCGSSELNCPYSELSQTQPDLRKCDKCSKCFHGECMPHARFFKTTHKYHCLNCQNIKAPNVADTVETSSANTNKRNLSAIHNINEVPAGGTKKKNASDNIVSNNEASKNSADFSNSFSNTVKIIEFHKQPQKKLKFNKRKNLTRKPHDTKVKTDKKNAKRKRSLSNEPTGEDIENNENECNDNEENEEDDEKAESGKVVSVNNNSSAAENNESKTIAGKKKRKKRGRLTLVSKKNKRSDSDKKPTVVSAGPSGSYQSLSSGPNGNPNRDKDLAMCANLLTEMAKNENSWPFAEKVDEKSYPDYYELIKEPMDIQTIRIKIKNKEYENKEQFAYDCRLIFDNCEFFNEDDSAIGKAGHKLRAYFETKWLKLFD